MGFMIFTDLLFLAFRPFIAFIEENRDLLILWYLWFS